MGKHGQLAKKRKLHVVASAITTATSGPEIGNSQVTEMKGDALSDLTLAIEALEFLGHNLDVYGSKALKSARIALFPLIKLQVPDLGLVVILYAV